MGIVGGTGPESTIDYYRSILALWGQEHADGALPRLLIYSIDGGGLWKLIEAGDLPAVAAVLADAVDRLAAAGAGAAILASNTVHLVFDEVAASASIPLFSIVEATRDAALSRQITRAGLFGTSFVVESSLYRAPFERAGIEIVTPTPDEQGYIHQIYVSELQKGAFLDQTRQRLVGIAAAMRERAAIDCLILGGTELSLLLPDPSYAGLPVLDSAKLHIAAAVSWLSREVNDLRDTRRSG